MWYNLPEHREDIEILANYVRSIARTPAFYNRLWIAQDHAPESANSTDIIIATGNLLVASGNSGNSDFAEEMANVYYTDRSDGTKYNAYKHMLWNAINAYYFTPEVAKIIGDAHEFGAVENLKQDSFQQSLLKMDLYNNQLGRDIGYQFYQEKLQITDPIENLYAPDPMVELAAKVYQAVESGQAMVIQ